MINPEYRYKKHGKTKEGYDINHVFDNEGYLGPVFKRNSHSGGSYWASPIPNEGYSRKLYAAL